MLVSHTLILRLRDRRRKWYTPAMSPLTPEDSDRINRGEGMERNLLNLEAIFSQSPVDCGMFMQILSALSSYTKDRRHRNLAYKIIANIINLHAGATQIHAPTCSMYDKTIEN